MDQTFPVTYSILSTEALVGQVLTEFDLGEISECRFFSAGFNDTYRVRTSAGATYFLRIYRKTWRTLPDIQYELEALLHLQRKGCPAIRPVAGRDGTLVNKLQAPEGVRYAVLFTEAPGLLVSFGETPQETARLYGQAVGRIHNSLQDFSCPYERFQIDLETLIDAPLRNIKPFLAENQEAWTFLRRFAMAVRQRIVSLPEKALEKGFCHGDFQGGHANISPDGTFTFFDFDCCGYGYHAYDLAVFRWQLDPQDECQWEPFLQGYHELHPLPELEIRAIPLFVAARRIWHMGVHTQNAADWGCGWLGQEYFKRRLQSLRELGERDLSIRV